MSDDLRRITDDWGYFCEVVWGQTLHDWQKDILRRLVSDGSVMTRMTLKKGISGASVDCIIVDDVYEKPVEEGSAKCVITKRLRDSCYLAFDDGTNDYTTATQAADRIEELEKQVNSAYTERNRLVALLASIYPSGLKATAIPGWDEEWHNCVYIDLPTGQASWHVHINDMHLFQHIGVYESEWDGHTTEEKYERIARAALEGKKDE